MIADLFLVLLLLLTAGYAAIHLLLAYGLTRVRGPKYTGPEQGISIIVAARNEERNIATLLASIAALRYPPEKFEVIIVDDRSTDRTAEIAQSFAGSIPHLSVLRVTENRTDMPHKKNALRTGIDRARFDILALTDADCVVPPTWLQALSDEFTDEVGVVAGYSPYAPERSASYLHYEEFKHSVIAASMIGLRNAILCTGRNFAYRRAVYVEAGGFESIKHSISGDDDLFLQHVQQNTRWHIRYVHSAEASVVTVPPSTFGEFLHQRVRHISASRYYSPKATLYYSLCHLFHLTAAAGLFIAPFTALAAWMIKFNADAVMSAVGAEQFRVPLSVRRFFFFESLLVTYTFLIGPAGLLLRFRWKESTI